MVTAFAALSLLFGATGSPGVLPFDPEAVVRQVSEASRHPDRSSCLADTTEFMLDTLPQGYTKTADRVLTPVVASDGENYLVVWRNVSNPDAILAVRVSGSGQLLDSTGIVLSGSGGYFALGDVAFGDSLYMVAWTVGYTPLLRCTRVSRDGEVLDPGGFPMSSSPRGDYSPAIAFTDSVFLVAWHTSHYGPRRDIRGARVTEAGQVLEPNGVLLHTGLSLLRTNRFAAVAAAGDVFLVAWESDETGYWSVHAIRVNSAGSILDSASFLVSGEGAGGSLPSVGSDGATFLVAWPAGDEASADIHAARVTVAGEVLDRDPLRICTAPQAQQEPSVACGGGSYFVAWQDWRNGNKDIYGTRVTPAGAVLDPDGILVARRLHEEQEPSVAFGAGNYLVAWLDYRWSNDADVFATRVSTSGAILDSAFPIPDTQPLIPVFPVQVVPDVAFDGENYLVVWEDHRTATNQWDIYGIRVSANGPVLDSAPFLISGAAGIQGNPAVAFGDSVFLVVWEDSRWGDRDIYGARVSRAGAVLDSAGILLHAGLYDQKAPSLAFGGMVFLVAYDNNGRAHCASVDQSGQVLYRLSLTSSAGAKTKPAVAFGDSIFLVSWEDWRYSQSSSKLHAIRISPSQGILDSTDFLVCVRWYCYVPAVAFNGDVFVVSWHEDGGRAVAAARVGSDGHALDSSGVTLISAPGRHDDVDVLSMSDRNIVVLRRDEMLYGVRTNQRLTEIDTSRLSQNPGKDRAPAVARGPGYQALVVYSCSTSAQLAHGAKAFRIWGRFHADSTPMPPALLWPPDGYRFHSLPVWFLVDTMHVDVDSFQFRVYVPGGDTVWSRAVVTPRCTVPDTLRTSGPYHWQCRVRNRYAWSRYSVPRDFGLRLTGFGEETGRQGECPVSATVVLRSRSPALAQGSAGDLEVYAMDGRRVALVRPDADGIFRWDFRDASGRQVSSGLYVVRHRAAQGYLPGRKFVLLD